MQVANDIVLICKCHILQHTRHNGRHVCSGGVHNFVVKPVKASELKFLDHCSPEGTHARRLFDD